MQDAHASVVGMRAEVYGGPYGSDLRQLVGIKLSRKASHAWTSVVHEHLFFADSDVVGVDVVDGEVVGAAGRGDHQVGVQIDEDRQDAGRDGDGGGGEREAVAVGVDQRGRG